MGSFRQEHWSGLPFPSPKGPISSVQSLSHVQLFATPWTSALQASLSITNSRSPPKPMSKGTTERRKWSCVRLFATPWTVAYQALPSMEFSWQEYWSGLPFPSSGWWSSDLYPHPLLPCSPLQRKKLNYNSLAPSPIPKEDTPRVQCWPHCTRECILVSAAWENDRWILLYFSNAYPISRLRAGTQKRSVLMAKKHMKICSSSLIIREM